MFKINSHLTRIIATAILLVLFNNANAQVLDTIIQTHGERLVSLENMVRDQDGNFYQNGVFAEEIQLYDTVLYSGNEPALSFLVKLDPEFNFLWAVTMDYSNPSIGYNNRLSFDEEGNIYMSDQHLSTAIIGGITLQPRPNGYGEFTVKLTPDGEILWVKPIYAHQIQFEQDGNLSLVRYMCTSDEINGVSIADNFGLTVLIDPSGNYIEHSEVSFPDYDWVTLMGITPDGNVFGLRKARTGYYKRTDIFKCTPDGNILNVSPFCYGYTDNSSSYFQMNLTYDKELGNYYLGGRFRNLNPVNFPDSTSYTGYSYKLVKLDQNFNHISQINLTTSFEEGDPTRDNYNNNYLQIYNNHAYIIGQVHINMNCLGEDIQLAEYEDQGFFAKLGPDLQPKWYHVLPECTYWARIMNKIHVDSSGIYPSGTMGAFTWDNFIVEGDNYGEAILARVHDMDTTDIFIEGYVFHDVNMNGQKDINEEGIADQTIGIAGSNKFVTTDQNGFYSIEGHYGANTVEALSTPDHWVLNTSSSIETTITTYNGSFSNFDFGIVPQENKTDWDVELVSITPKLNNNNSNYQIICRNKGTVTGNATIKFIKDPKTTILSTNPSYDQIIGDTLYWNLSNIPSNTNQIITVNSQINPDCTSALITYATVESDQNDLNPSDNYSMHHIDLSEKQAFTLLDVSPGYDINYEMLSEGVSMQYTLKFYNYTSTTVDELTISQNLPEQLNLNTFRIFNHSHNCSAKIKDGLLTIKYSDIDLDPAVDGVYEYAFVTFNVMLKDNIWDAQSFTDKATVIYNTYNRTVSNTQTTNILTGTHQLDVVIYDEDCQGSGNGSLAIENAPNADSNLYSIDATNYTPTPGFTDLSAGTYYIRRLNQGQIQVSGPFEISPAPELMINEIELISPNCYGEATGIINVDASSETGSIVFSLNDGPFQSGSHFGEIPSGTYTVNIQDANGCIVSSEENTLLDPDSVYISEITAYPPSCYGESGAISIQAMGGTYSYQYSLDDWNYSYLDYFNGIMSGEVDIYVKDDWGCKAHTTYFMDQPDSLYAQITTAFNEQDGGSISVDAFGGTEPYEYSLNGGNYTNSPEFNHLYTPIHSIRVRDSEECLKSYLVEIEGHTDIEQNKNEYLLYPNPTDGLLFIQVSDKNLLIQEEYQISDIKGRILQMRQLPQSGFLDLNEFEQGIYYLKILGQKTSTNHKIIIQR